LTEETLTPREERFERRRRTVGLFLGPGTAIILFLIPMTSLSRPAHTLAAVIGWVVVWWITEPIPLPMTALLGSALCVLSGVANA
jgi:sodium-dependent dicarboxylate transporter 2/3/5